MKLDFYYTPTACSLASHIALEESGLPFEAHYVKLHREEERLGYRAIVPTGRVPALAVDNTILMENVAILTLISKLSPDAQLMPPAPIEAANCLSILAFFASEVHISGRQMRAPVRFTGDTDCHPSISAAGRERFKDNLKRIDAMLTGSDWLIGGTRSVADCYSLVFYAWALADGQDVTSLSNYTALVERMMARPGVRRALQRERHPLLSLTP